MLDYGNLNHWWRKIRWIFTRNNFFFFCCCCCVKSKNTIIFFLHIFDESSFIDVNKHFNFFTRYLYCEILQPQPADRWNEPILILANLLWRTCYPKRSNLRKTVLLYSFLEGPHITSPYLPQRMELFWTSQQSLDLFGKYKNDMEIHDNKLL